ncbi:cyclin-dependent protein kinase inhibitor smr4 [Quercus suber]|uniref:Cyclin-dependent protein kinase inhibitor smr4 n=1 Tax=Quercus suber TaxID=58331 RepID=A0AAW0J1T1_QUESU|nr:cyclin-dependent protein kinase inhibitor smr4 [Quercus suber]
MEGEKGAHYDEVGCATPRRCECQIPVASLPPPPPKKKPFALGKKRVPPKNGYFHPPDLDLFFAMAPTRQACA